MGTYVLTKLPYEPKIMAPQRQRCTWSEETLQQFNINSVGELVEDIENRSAIIQQIMDAHSQSIECKNDESIHKDFSHLDLQEFTLTFPDREGYIAPNCLETYVSGLEKICQSV